MPISYKGGNISTLEVIANHIPLVMTGLPNLLPQHRAGKIKILGITDSKRSVLAPDVPAIAETVPGYEFKNWFGLIVAAGTPNGVIEKINKDVNAILANAETRQRLLDQGYDVLGGSQQTFAQTIDFDIRKFADIIKTAGIK